MERQEIVAEPLRFVPKKSVRIDCDILMGIFLLRGYSVRRLFPAGSVSVDFSSFLSFIASNPFSV